jgi:hypothetical protein
MKAAIIPPPYYAGRDGKKRPWVGLVRLASHGALQLPGKSNGMPGAGCRGFLRRFALRLLSCGKLRRKKGRLEGVGKITERREAKRSNFDLLIFFRAGCRGFLCRFVL